MNVYDFAATRIDGQVQSFSDFRGKVLLIVNTASRCGFTPQYRELQALYNRHRDQGFEILAFPCNQFGGQEPGTSEDIQSFCETNYGVTFPLFQKVNVNGPSTHPLFQYLKETAKGALRTEAIKWNFTKFLVDRSGNVIKRYAPNTTPDKLEPTLLHLLNP